MYLDAASTGAAPAVGYSSGKESSCGVFEPWKEWEPSPISHHGTMCCEIAREWLGATDYSVLNGGKLQSGPRWLRQRFDWGPSKYPIFWCEVLKKKKLDCGVHAALAHEVFTQRGVRSYRVQLVQEFTECASTQWRLSWEKDEAVTAWIRDELIYHEGCAVECGDGRIKLWDSSAGWWIDPKTTSGYGSLRAVRIAAARQGNFNWGHHEIEPNTWSVLD